MAYPLDDANLKTKAREWVDAFLDAVENGWIGPVEAELPGVDERYSPWPRFVVMKVFRQYYKATGNEAAVTVMTDLCAVLSDRLADEPLDWWFKDRWQELVLGIHWLPEQTGESWLLELAETAAEQGFDWTDHFARIRDVNGEPEPARHGALHTRREQRDGD